MKQSMTQLAHKIELNKEQKALKKAQNVKKAKRVLFGLAFILLVALMVTAMDKTVQFFKENTIIKYQMVSVKFHAPFEVVSLSEVYRREQNDKMIEEISQRVTEEYLNPKIEVPKDCKVEAQIDPKVFFATLRTKESSNGKNTDPTALHNYCANKGMWNEIGYNPQKKFCFKDQEEASLYVAYYVKKNCDGKTQAQCECFWNTGDMTDSCHYSKGELSKAN